MGAGGIKVEGGVGLVLYSGVGVGVESAEAVRMGIAAGGRDWES